MCSIQILKICVGTTLIITEQMHERKRTMKRQAMMGKETGNLLRPWYFLFRNGNGDALATISPVLHVLAMVTTRVYNSGISPLPTKQETSDQIKTIQNFQIFLI
jgi:hypothetical protein